MRHLTLVLALGLALATPALAADRAKAEKALKDACAAGNADGVQGACDELIECGGKDALAAVLAVAAKAEGSIYWQLTAGASGFRDAAALDELGKFIVRTQADAKGSLARDLLFGLQNNHASGVTTPLAHVLEKGTYDLKLMAVDQLAVIRSGDAADALVAAAKREEKGDPELRTRIENALRLLTGESFASAADWEKWWKDQKPKGLPAPKQASGGAAGTPGGTMEKPRDNEWKGTIDKLPGGRIVVVKGVFDKTQNILMQNGIPFTLVEKTDFNTKPQEYLKNCYALLINCDEYHDKKTKISDEALAAVKQWVEGSGGFLFTEDWGLVDITAINWPDKITTLPRPNEKSDPPLVKETTVKITPAKGNTTHPLMRGVWQKPRPVVVPKASEEQKTVERTDSPAQPLKHKWKIDELSACMKIVDTQNVIVLLESEDLAKEQNGTPFVAVTFRVGSFKPEPTSKKTATGPGAGSGFAGGSSPKTQEWNPLAKGGRVLHVMSHYGHQSSQDDGQALQNLLVNFLLEAMKHHP